MQVTTTTLEMHARPDAPRPLPSGTSADRVAAMTPEYARFLYALVGGPWQWNDRLAWRRDQWADELAAPGTEYWVAQSGGAPVGYVQLGAAPGEHGTDAEIRYFGLVESAIGQGLGAALLERGIDAAWTLAERHPVDPVTRVWVHTCTLDGPAALSNYQRRGFVVCDVVTAEQDVPSAALGAWRATGGPA